MDSKHISKYDTLLASPTRTVAPPAVTLVLRVVAGILAAFVVGLIAIIIIWSWWRLRTARVCAQPSSESRPDPDENTKACIIISPFEWSTTV
ncbi:hypothetical protein ONZ45_g15987 [Pleurotus djamor]|nr:hypothetical protein ONZ45_g15987 [Pleurotus djamor]